MADNCVSNRRLYLVTNLKGLSNRDCEGLLIRLRLVWYQGQEIPPDFWSAGALCRSVRDAPAKRASLLLTPLVPDSLRREELSAISFQRWSKFLPSSVERGLGLGKQREFTSRDSDDPSCGKHSATAGALWHEAVARAMGERLIGQG